MTQEQEYLIQSEASNLLCRARILYMEDDIGLGRLLQKRLERMACSVDIARDGQKGLEMFASGSYDVVVADYNMPLVNGLEVLQKLKEITSVIMLTGQGDEKVAVDAMKLGAADYVIKDADGEYLEFLPAIIDRVIERQQLIRDRQQALADLQASEARCRAIVEDQTEMICRFQPGGQLTFANPSFCRYFGLPQADVVFQNISSILTKKAFRPLQEVLKMLTTGNPVASKTHDISMADGVSRRLQWISRGIFDAGGKISEYQMVGRDITEQGQLEEVLRQTEEKYSALLAAIPDLLLRIDQQGICLDVRSNQSPILNLPPDAVGKHVGELFSRSTVTLLQEGIRKVLMDVGSRGVPLVLRQGDDNSQVTITLIFAGENEVLALFRDTSGL